MRLTLLPAWITRWPRYPHPLPSPGPTRAEEHMGDRVSCAVGVTMFPRVPCRAANGLEVGAERLHGDGENGCVRVLPCASATQFGEELAGAAREGDGANGAALLARIANAGDATPVRIEDLPPPQAGDRSDA